MIRLPFIRLSISLLQVALVADPAPECEGHEVEEGGKTMSIGFTSHITDEPEDE